MRHRQQWFNALRAFRRVAVLCAVLPLVAQAASAQFRDIYPDPSVAKTEIRAALKRAEANHKNVILDFGGNWCGDCKVLNIYFRDPANLPLLNANYELVDVNIGNYDANLDIAAKYSLPIKTGVPILVVLSSSGKVLYATRNREFEKMTKLDSSDVTKFLNDWKPTLGGARGGR
jgi:thiol-disulfide isomerase/thioredoxin